jgi:hypothetical protein
LISEEGDEDLEFDGVVSLEVIGEAGEVGGVSGIESVGGSGRSG